ncbi:MAG: peptidase [Alphaproteobacteria bacterium]|nr:peptidase [Alphaproteobacteria bacterium]
MDYIMKKFTIAAALAATLFSTTAIAAAPSTEDVLATYANIAHAGYEDSLSTAKALQAAIATLVATPTEDSLSAAKAAWLAARAPYQQTEAYRFGNAIVDDFEGLVNAWPLDEGLIDYVDASYGTESDENPYYTANVIANPKLNVAGTMVDASKITKELLADTLQEADEVGSNVATGYHAIEFLLWGQDLNGTGPGAGTRAATDYDTANCTNGNCDRRAEYITAATDLLIDDLEGIVGAWSMSGEARAALADGGVAAIFSGLGSLSYGELAGERIKLGLIVHDPEEEHDCFSDNTHNSHYYDILGIQNVYTGSYTRVDGSVVEGPSIEDLLADKDAAVAKELTDNIAATVAAGAAMVKRAETIEAYDQMIGEGNTEGNAVVQAVVDGLVTQTKSLEKAVSALGLSGIEFEGSDSLDAPEKV